MSEAALLELNNAQAALVAALDAHDLESIESATAAVAGAVEQVRSAGAWRDRVYLRDDLIHLLRSAEAVRGRLNGLADMNRRKLDRLIALTGQPRVAAYGRSGRLR